MHNELQDLERQLGEVNVTLANLAAKKARMASQWVAERISTPLGDRLSVETEIAEATARKADVAFKIHQAKVAHQEGRRTDMYSALVKIVRDNKLDHLLDEASSLVEQSLAATGVQA